MKEPRSHIEGATPSTAIWSFGVVPDPFTPPGRHPVLLDRRIPVERLPPAGDASSGMLDRVYRARSPDRAADEQSQAAAQPAAPRGRQARRRRSRATSAELERARLRVRGLTKRRRRPGGAGGRRPRPAAMPTRPTRSATQAAQLHRRPITVEMTLQRLPDHQGQDRRAGLCRDPGDQSPHRRRVRGRHLSDQGILHQPL